MKKRTKFLHEKEYAEYFSKLIELEREEEIKFHTQEIEKLSPSQREKLGRAITKLKPYKKEITPLGKFRIHYIKSQGEIKNTEIKIGDVVLISTKNPLEESIDATVESIGNKNIIVVFDTKPPKKYFDKRKFYRVDLYVNETTYKRMQSALNKVKAKKSEFPLDVLFGQETPHIYNLNLKISYFNSKLNTTQKNAIIKALNSKELYLIHGPPGTGKTTTLVEIALQLAHRNKKVLISADSNTAVDNFLEKFSKYAQNINYTRIGNTTRTNPLLIEHTLDYKVANAIGTDKINNIYETIDKYENELKKYIKPTPANRRGFSRKEIIALAKKGKSLRGLSINKIRKMAKHIEIEEKIKELKNEINTQKKKAIEQILKNTQVVFATNSTTESEILSQETFDVVIIDEATQATEPSALMPLIKAKKAILAGDHKQLPPTIMSMKAKELGLDRSLFERFIELYPNMSTTLTIQYRMNTKIMNFSNKMFYDMVLEAHDSVKNHTIAPTKSISSVPITFINIESMETKKKGSTSYMNIKEAEKIKEIVNELITEGYKPEQIGIISPYQDQVELLKKIINIEGIEIKSIDGFQGKEKEIIIISLVRSNPKNKIGFLVDERRLNVALTRAKKKVIILGNEKTLKSNNTYNKLLEYIKQEGEVIY